MPLTLDLGHTPGRVVGFVTSGKGHSPLLQSRSKPQPAPEARHFISPAREGWVLSVTVVEPQRGGHISHSYLSNHVLIVFSTTERVPSFKGHRGKQLHGDEGFAAWLKKHNVDYDPRYVLG